MIQITVGQVAGVIAAAIFVARLWSPNALTFILSGILRDRNSAATWTLSARAFQRSLWPVILRTDSSQNRGVRKDILLVTRLISLMSILLILTSVITPLGLYEALDTSHSIQTPFQYIKDTSPFGTGTPPRSNLSFSRQCGGTFGLQPCPFSDTVVIDVTDSNGGLNQTFPYGYDTNIPQIVKDIYSSGTSNSTTVSNYFDIQWRRYLTASDPKFDNGSTFLISGFRSVQSLVLNNKVQPVEGLIVDMVGGGIGLRNHTIPQGFQYGAAWSEDILFIEPETVCVDTNLTLDYSIAQAPNQSLSVIDVVLTDRGGFINLKHTFPEPNITNPQANADLWTRAYKAAWMNNALSALYYNVTDDNNRTDGTRSFSYVNSALNKTFQVPQAGDLPGPFYNLGTTDLFGGYLGIGQALENSTDPAASGLLPNPFNIQSNNFSDISTECSTAGGLDFANVTNIFVLCGLMYGAPQRQDTGSSLIFDSGSKWSQPLYTCASAVKATVKTVSLSYNGTEGLLENLNITSIQDKVYSDNQSLPLWGVENTGNAYLLEDLTLVWGLISDEYENNENVSAVRQKSLYLPGFGVYGSISTIGFDNMPGSEALTGAMGIPYSVSAGGSLLNGQPDYSGASDMSMWVRWQNLSSSAELASLIPSLIWTDIAASAVVGTKGVLGPGNTATENQVPIMVTPTVMKIKYHYPYAIPALLTALVLVFVTIAAFTVVLFGHGSISRIRLHLQQLSAGRIYTTFLYPEPGIMAIKSKQWARAAGKKIIDLSGEFPMAGDETQMHAGGVGVSDQKLSGFQNVSGEQESFLNGMHNGMYRPEGALGGQELPPQQHYGVIPRRPVGSGGEMGRY